MDSSTTPPRRPHSAPPGGGSVPHPPPPPLTPEQRRAQGNAQPVIPRPELKHPQAPDSGWGNKGTGNSGTTPSSTSLAERKAEVLDTSVEFVDLKKPLDPEKIKLRDEMLAVREKGIARLRDLMAQEWVKASSPEIIRALQDSNYAVNNNIRIVLVVDGQPVHLAPANPEDNVSPEDLKMFQEYVQSSLAQFCQDTPSLDAMSGEIKGINKALKQLDGKLKSFGVNIHKDIEDDMLKNNTVVVVDMSRRDKPVIWGEPGNIPDSAINRHKSSMAGGDVHFIKNSDDEGPEDISRRQMQRSRSWEDFSNDDRGDEGCEGTEPPPVPSGRYQTDKETPVADEPYAPDPDYEYSPAAPSYEHALQLSRLTEEQREELRKKGEATPGEAQAGEWTRDVLKAAYDEAGYTAMPNARKKDPPASDV